MCTMLAAAAASGALLAAPAGAHFKKCPGDAVKIGQGCMDTYEASVWRVPDPTGANKSLVKKVEKGKATAADLLAKGATQLGVASDDYAPCTDQGGGCADVFAVSVAGVIPSSRITWFQAQEACTNAGKRLPANGEWQQAVAGTPDPGGDNGATDCNTASALVAVATGSRSGCVSSRGAFDMVGNVLEWVADWVPESMQCPGWGGFSNDLMCLSGASTTALGPGALLRGGGFFFGGGPDAGPLSVVGGIGPSVAGADIGFRCAR
jgi:hypothetical protein